MHPTLKFTHEWSKTEINFLDLTLYKGERFKNTQILDINASVNLVTHFNIFLEIHLIQMHAFQAWSKVKPFVIFETLVQETEYEQKLDFFISKLLTRGYKKSDVLNCLADISYKRRNIYIEDIPKMKKKYL